MRRFSLFGQGNDKIFDMMKICDLSEEDRLQNEIPHLHEFYSVFWIREGEAVHATDFVEYHLPAGSVLFVPPGLKHRLVLNNRAGGDSLIFNEEFICFNRKNHVPLKEYKLFNNLSFRSIITLDGSGEKKFEQVFGFMSDEIQKKDSYSPDIILNLLHLLLLESRRIFDMQYEQPEKQSDEHADTQAIIQFKLLIEDHFKNHKNVSSYASMLNMNPSCLNEVSKKATGITAGEMIRNKVIGEAKRMLYASDLSGKEIAFELGFDDPAYFSRFFKKYTGQTLKHFRDLSRKKYH
ncbi:MAG: helix-turn-helix domain-containing protein [Prolixibacteraceae bacterium]|jgi:AraC-like DNA-binding protein|nr:helix-turn-helix domain-containing protein [Prolixibacteraceae bacterium]